MTQLIRSLRTGWRRSGLWTLMRRSQMIGTTKKMANPEYEDDDAVYKFADFGFIGFDLWQVKGGSIFDNIIITDDKAEADKFAEKWKALSNVETEKKKEEEAKKKEEEAKAPAPNADEDDDDD